MEMQGWRAVLFDYICGRFVFIVPYCIGILLALAAIQPSNARAAEVAAMNGVALGENAGDEVYAREVVELEQVFTLGLDDDREIFGAIAAIAQDEAGNVYVLDTQLSRVTRYSPDGKPLGVVCRDGDGPGEVRYPIDLFWTGDRKLGIVQVFPARIVQVELDGTPAGSSWQVSPEKGDGSLYWLMAGQQTKDDLVLAMVKIVTDAERGVREKKSFLATCNIDGTIEHVIQEHVAQYVLSDLRMTEANEYSPLLGGWSVGPAGRIYAVAARDDYRIIEYRHDGSVVREFRMDYEPLERTPDEYAHAMGVMRGKINRMRTRVKGEVSKFEPAIISLHVAGDGSIWVLSSRGCRHQPDGIMATYDVFTADGVLTKRVAIACDGDGAIDRLVFLGNRVYRIVGYRATLDRLEGGAVVDIGGEGDVSSGIVCYQIAGS